jgi:hypothetical protein
VRSCPRRIHAHHGARRPLAIDRVERERARADQVAEPLGGGAAERSLLAAAAARLGRVDVGDADPDAV